MEKTVQPQTDATRAEEKPQNDRTPGLKLLDVFLYPVLTNFSVFAISVAATYLTARGGDKNASGKLIYGKAGKWFQDRGEWMTNKFKASGMSHEQADMSKMVFFSFADGSLMAPVIKLLEDRREKIGRWLDEKMGTVPDDPGVYEAEPKHSWLSVLGGRFITAGIVVPTAIALDKTGLNNKLFIEPGKKMGAWLSKKPNVAKAFSPFGLKLDVKELSKVSFFEAFYTSVCTLGLYLTSRRIAHFHHKSKVELEQETLATEALPVASATPPAEESSAEKTLAHEGLKRQRASAEITPISHAEKYHAAEVTNVPAMLGA